MLDAGLGVPTGTVQPCSTAQVVQLQGSGSNKVMAEYIWLGGTGADLKSRTVVLDERPQRPEDLPIAEIDGSSYGQAAAESCEIYLQPKKIFPDPFRGGDHVLVLCDTYVPPLACHPGLDPWEHMQHHRPACEAAMQHAGYSEPVFTMQQEYCVLGDASAPKPRFSNCGGSFAGGGAAPVPIKPSAGLSEKAASRLGREVSELHMQACLGAGLAYGGCHASGPCWAYKIGPCRGVDAADQLSLSRFLLGRVAEHSEAAIAYDALTSGAPAAAANKCVVQFSTAASRDPHAGLLSVQDMMERLHSASHAHALLGIGAPAGSPGCPPVARSGSWHSASGAFNGMGGASSGGGSGHGVAAPLPHGPPAFTIGVGNKAAAIMVPTSTLLNKCGPILDQRPPASADPYLATMLLLCSALGLPLPPATLSSMQLAAAATLLRAANGAAALSAGRGAGSCHSYGSASLGGSPSCTYSGDNMYGSADSAEVLLSALDRLDGGGKAGRWAAGSGLRSCAASSGDDEALSDVCSDASSPPLMGCHGLAAAVAVGDQEMFYE